MFDKSDIDWSDTPNNDDGGDGSDSDYDDDSDGDNNDDHRDNEEYKIYEIDEVNDSTDRDGIIKSNVDKTSGSSTKGKGITHDSYNDICNNKSRIDKEMDQELVVYDLGVTVGQRNRSSIEQGKANTINDMSNDNQLYTNDLLGDIPEEHMIEVFALATEALKLLHKSWCHIPPARMQRMLEKGQCWEVLLRKVRSVTYISLNVLHV